MNFWNGRPVFVTGATGLMGSWLVKHLLAESAQVIALVRDRVPDTILARDGLLERCTIVHGDVLDFSLLRRSLSEYSIDTVFHLAAQPLVGVAKLDPMSTLDTNIRGTWQLLEAARLSHTKQTVVASSDKAYGNSDQLPYSESHPLQGLYPYDVSKSCTDLISLMYAKTYGMRVSVLRCANLFGGGDLNFSRSIPGAVQATLRGQQFVIRSDGQFVRDFLYVKDAARGYMKVAECLAQDASLAGEAFNLSLEVRLTVEDVVNAVLRLTDRRDLQPIILNQASAEIREQYMTCEKIRTRLGWKPEYSFEQGLLETIEWYQGFFGSTETRAELTGSAIV